MGAGGVFVATEFLEVAFGCCAGGGPIAPRSGRVGGVSIGMRLADAFLAAGPVY